MTLIDDIKRDREQGTKGPFRLTDGFQSTPLEVAGCCLSLFGKFHDTPPHRQANTRRLNRVPEMEAALLAAEELARVGDMIHAKLEDPQGSVTIFDQNDLHNALAAYREATK